MNNLAMTLQDAQKQKCSGMNGKMFLSDTTDVEKTKDTGGLSNSDYPEGEAEKDENVEEDDECHLGLLLSGEAKLRDLKNLGLETIRLVYK